MYAKSIRPSAKREIQKEWSAKRDDRMARPRRAQTCDYFSYQKSCCTLVYRRFMVEGSTLFRNQSKRKKINFNAFWKRDQYTSIKKLHSRSPITRSSSNGGLSASSATGIPSISYLLLCAVMRII